ncbi:MAG: FISUMP domain-containing protein, partial [Candidatus Absconditabacteria bacterium]
GEYRINVVKENGTGFECNGLGEIIDTTIDSYEIVYLGGGRVQIIYKKLATSYLKEYIIGQDGTITPVTESSASYICDDMKLLNLDPSETKLICESGGKPLLNAVKTNDAQLTINTEGFFNVGDTRQVSCTKPANSVYNTLEQITQTYDGENWLPTNAGVYSEIGSSTECKFKCVDDFSLQGNQCITSILEGATGTFTLSQTSVTQGTIVTISNNCSTQPTSYSSSNEAVATIAGTTITTLSAGTTNITPVGGACGDNAQKTLTVTSPPITDWRLKDPNCDKPDVIIGTQTWAGCNSTLGTGFEYGQTDVDIGTSNYSGMVGNCYDYSGNNTAICTKGDIKMASNTKANTWFTGTNINSDSEVDNIWGKYYTFVNSTSACATGYHVPTDLEWEYAEEYLFEENGGATNCRNTIDLRKCDGIGWKLHSTTNATNNLAVKLGLPLSGNRRTDGINFSGRGNHTYLWSSTIDGANAYDRYFDTNNSKVYRSSNDQMFGFSVRCIKD